MIQQWNSIHRIDAALDEQAKRERKYLLARRLHEAARERYAAAYPRFHEDYGGADHTERSEQLSRRLKEVNFAYRVMNRLRQEYDESLPF